MKKYYDGYTYTTKAEYNESPAGLRLLKDWGSGDEWEKRERKAKAAARRLLPSLAILRGHDFLGGLAYTSTSDFAALWNVNTEAKKRGTRDYLEGIAITADDGRAVAFYIERDENGAEIGYKYEII